MVRLIKKKYIVIFFMVLCFNSLLFIICSYAVFLLYFLFIMDDQYNLKWNDHQSNIQETFKSIREDNENLSDVTLMFGDQIVRAHKLVLSASSEYFQTIFRKCWKENTVIVLKSLSQPQLSSLLLDFIYNGEVKIDQDNLNPFLAVAEELKIKGLTFTNKGNKGKEEVYAPYSNSSSQLLQSSSNLLQSSDIQTFPSYEEICKQSLGKSYIIFTVINFI